MLPQTQRDSSLVQRSKPEGRPRLPSGAAQPSAAISATIS